MATRRGFLAGASFLSLVHASQVLGREYGGEAPWLPGEALAPSPLDPSRRYLSAAERGFLAAAVDRLIPPDEFPGAEEAGVVDFIYGRLAGSFGRGDMFYLSDPVHGGNRDMAGWRMIGFSGARYNYRPHINHNGAALNFEPVSVGGFSIGRGDAP